MPELPRWGYIQNIGKVRIVEYHGSDLFRVLDRKDEYRLIHRDRIEFRKS